MTLSLRNTLRSLSLLVLTAAFLPGCDGEEFEALGLSVEEVDAMSPEELDELANLEPDLEPDIGLPVPPSDPDPMFAPGPVFSAAGTHHAADPLHLADPVRPTHDDERPLPLAMPAPPPTHDSPNDNVFDLSDAEEIGGCDTHGGDYPEFSNG